MTNEEFYSAAIDELRAIRKLLETRPATGTPAQRGTSSYSIHSAGQTGDQAPIPQPDEIVADPGDVQCHYGKNNGVALSSMTERQLSFYASVKTPRLDSSGKPFPPRPVDVHFENAARTLWHQNKNTLAGGYPARTPPPDRHPTGEAPKTQGELEEDVPF